MDALSAQQLRQQYRHYRRQLSAQQQQWAAEQLSQQLLAHPKIISAQRIAVYLAFDGELDLSPLMQRLWQQHKQLYLPVIHPFSVGHLLFFQFSANTPLINNRYRIQQPRLDIRYLLPLDQLDILLVPLVAFDAQGQRLGMGGGFYDRTLQAWQQQRYTPIGIAHDGQYCNQLPSNHWDIPLPEIVTPTQHWQWPTAIPSP